MARKGQKFKKYSIELKMKVIKEALEEGKPARFLEKKYGINFKTIDTWIYQYKRGNRFDKKRGIEKGQIIDWKVRYKILQEYSTFLEKQNNQK